MARNRTMSEHHGAWLRRMKMAVRRVATPDRVNPVLGEGVGGPEGSPHTFVMVCGPGFDVRVPNAACTIRLGMCRGFAQVGVRYQLVSVFELARVLPTLRSPFVCLTVYDFENLSRAARQLLRDVPHCVWVNPWFDDLERLYAEYSLPDPRLPEPIARRVADCNPAFVWAPVPPGCLQFYQSWARLGLRVESVLLACDTTRYFPDPDNDLYRDVDMAFVGGYRSYKDVQYEKYLRPYEDRLRVFGYDRWPYRGYGGLLPDDHERILYQNVRACPALREPHPAVIGDIVERAFTIIGTGGLAVPAGLPFHRERFS